jgi:predicted transposase/invertase (TIGR01784 family)
MALGIRPINEFAFKKTFGTPENRLALISLLNAILQLEAPIVDVTIENPYNLQDFYDDKLSILDIKAIDQLGRIHNVEMQLTAETGLVQRIVFYGCELYSGQMKLAENYEDLHSVHSICLLDGRLWRDSPKVHHTFRLTDLESARVLSGTLEIHTLELGWYNMQEADLATASTLESWLYWLLHAHEYEIEELLKLFPQAAIQQASQTIRQISEITEDKIMYDSREKAIRDRNWLLSAAERRGEARGEARGEVKGRISTLQEILSLPITSDETLSAMSLEQLKELAGQLSKMLRERNS